MDSFSTHLVFLAGMEFPHTPLERKIWEDSLSFPPPLTLFSPKNGYVMGIFV